MQDLDREISEKYELNISSITPFKDTFIICSDRGRKVLKRTDLSSDRIEFIHGAKEHLYNNGFKRLDRYLSTIEEKPYMDINGCNYIISDIIEGRECNFSSGEDVIKSSRALAEMHRASKGYVYDDPLKTRDDLGKLPIYFSKRLEEIKKLKKVAKKGKSKFDYLFLQYIDLFYDMGEKTIAQLMNSNYNILCENARKEGSFCHHDYTHSNIICSDDGVSIINFDFCCFELKVYDIANLLRRKMRKCNWNIKDAEIILKEYQTIESLSSDDFIIMRFMLQFPQKFWRVVNKFYNSKRSWTEKSYVLKLNEVIDEIEPHKKFMESYDELSGC